MGFVIEQTKKTNTREDEINKEELEVIDRSLVEVNATPTGKPKKGYVVIRSWTEEEYEELRNINASASKKMVIEWADKFTRGGKDVIADVPVTIYQDERYRDVLDTVLAYEAGNKDLKPILENQAKVSGDSLEDFIAAVKFKAEAFKTAKVVFSSRIESVRRVLNKAIEGNFFSYVLNKKPVIDTFGPLTTDEDISDFIDAALEHISTGKPDFI